MPVPPTGACREVSVEVPGPVGVGAAWENPAVSEETWRPLGVGTEDEIAEYDALHDDGT